MPLLQIVQGLIHQPSPHPQIQVTILVMILVWMVWEYGIRQTAVIHEESEGDSGYSASEEDNDSASDVSGLSFRMPPPKRRKICLESDSD